MKRQGDNTVNQPAVKKPDVNVSTDFRSKIGAKLQTLLNGFTPEKRFPRNRRQLYEDLFGERQHSTIIIDPTIVIKSEPDEESSNDTTNFNSQDFLLSAKTRITELLNKKQDDTNKRPFKDNEKENSLSSNECTPTSSLRLNSSYTQTKAQSLLNSSFKKKRKAPCKRGHTSGPTESNSCNMSAISEQSMELVAKDHATNEMSDSCVAIPEVQCIISEGSSLISESNPNIHFSTGGCNSTASNHQQNVSKSTEIVKTSGSVTLGDSHLTPALMPFGDILIQKNTSDFPCNNEDDSELVDDPGPHQEVPYVAVSSTLNESNYEMHEPDVVLLCVKRPTHEVITLEDDNDDFEDIIEEVHKCVQCGKAFRAKSLLNFHIRMHGSHSSSALSSSSQSCSA